MNVRVAAVMAGGELSWPDLKPSVRRKALLELGGFPLVHHVLEALANSDWVNTLIVAGLEEEALPSWRGRAAFLPDAGGLVENMLEARAYVHDNYPGCGHSLVCSCDLPLVTSEVIDRFLGQCEARDVPLYYPVVPEEVMNARFPSSGRTFVRTRDGRFTGGNMIFIDPDIQTDIEFMKRLVARRKNLFGLARLLGLGFMIKFAMGRLSSQEAASRLGALSGTRFKVIHSPDAEIAMDLDTPRQYERIRRETEEAR